MLKVVSFRFQIFISSANYCVVNVSVQWYCRICISNFLLISVRSPMLSKVELCPVLYSGILVSNGIDYTSFANQALAILWVCYCQSSQIICCTGSLQFSWQDIVTGTSLPDAKRPQYIAQAMNGFQHPNRKIHIESSQKRSKFSLFFSLQIVFPFL